MATRWQQLNRMQANELPDWIREVGSIATDDRSIVYYDDGIEAVEEPIEGLDASEPESLPEETVSIVVVVHGRLFWEQASVHIDAPNECAYIREEDYEKLF